MSGAQKLKLNKGRVNALQLQTLRELEPSSAQLLAARLGTTANMLSVRALKSSRGGGFQTDAEQRKRIEEAAIQHVTRHFLNKGYKVGSVENEKMGFDLKVAKGDVVLHVEVKGVGGTGRDVILTRQELERCRSDKRSRLVVVTNALDAPQLHDMSGKEVCSQYEFIPLSFTAKFRGRDEKA